MNRRPKCSDIPTEEILEACRRFHAREDRRTPDEVLADKYPVKVIMAKMQKMHERNLLDYGVSLRTAWPTTEQERLYRKHFGMASEGAIKRMWKDMLPKP